MGGWDAVSLFHCETVRCFAPYRFSSPLITACVLDIQTHVFRTHSRVLDASCFRDERTYSLFFPCRKLHLFPPPTSGVFSGYADHGRFHDAELLFTSPSSVRFLYEMWIMNNRSITVFSGLALSLSLSLCACVRAWCVRGACARACVRVCVCVCNNTGLSSFRRLLRQVHILFHSRHMLQLFFDLS